MTLLITALLITTLLNLITTFLITTLLVAIFLITTFLVTLINVILHIYCLITVVRLNQLFVKSVISNVTIICTVIISKVIKSIVIVLFLLRLNFFFKSYRSDNQPKEGLRQYERIAR